MAPFVLLFCCVLLPVVSRAQEVDTPLFWILADSVNSSATCPGRCLAVNDSSEGEYDNKPAVFVACQGTVSSSESSSSQSDSNNHNQQWLRLGKAGEKEIQFNATAATNAQSILCLQPDPATSNRTLKVAKCTQRANQKWIVANNSIASLAFDPPRYLAMSYRLAGFLNASDGPIGWREATLLPSTPPHNNSFTTTFSMVDSTLDPQQPTPPPANESRDSHNFISNGGFEQSSYDFPNKTAELSLSESDPFSLCNWQVMRTDAKLLGGPDPAPPEGNRSLYLKAGIVKQNAATLAGAFYALVFKVARATPPPQADSSDANNQCNNSDTLSVNLYPSTNVHMDVEVRNKTWTTKHVSFQALGDTVQLAFQGCDTCGCHLDDVNLMQVLDSAPFPPPPPRPSRPGTPNDGSEYKEPPPRLPYVDGVLSHSSRLSNGAVVGIVVGAAALFFVIGAACVGVVGVNKKEERKESEIGMGRPPDWSIHTTTPPQSQRGGRGSSSNAPVSPATLPAHVSTSTVETSHVSASTVETSPPLSSSNLQGRRSA